MLKYKCGAANEYLFYQFEWKKRESIEIYNSVTEKFELDIS